MSLNHEFLGAHISFNQYITESISNHIKQYIEPIPPCQSFLIGLSESDIEECQCLIDQYNISYFTHSAFTINISNPKCDVSRIQKDFQYNIELGGKGVVVHVGKSKETDVDEALNNMEKSIRKILPYAIESCPLLLETPAGQGTELCTTFEDFSLFYKRFKNDPRFKVCIDTCHVFATGYDPYEYITKFNDEHPNSIKLIHFNDSLKPCNCHVDRHAAIGTGYIDLKSLIKVSEWCLENKIPMVTE